MVSRWPFTKKAKRNLILQSYGPQGGVSNCINQNVAYHDFKVRKMAKIRKRYNQVPHLTQDTTWESNKNTINITNKSQEASPFPADDRETAMNRREIMRNTRHKKHKWSTKTLKSSVKPVVRIQNNFVEMITVKPSTKIAKNKLIRKKRPPVGVGYLHHNFFWRSPLKPMARISNKIIKTSLILQKIWPLGSVVSFH